MLLMAAGGLGGEPLAAQTEEMTPGEELRVFHMIFGPGDHVWEQFGHNAIWIHDPGAGSDLVYNWGMFDFTDEDFLTNFIRGRMLYWVAPIPIEHTLAQYQLADRSIIVQELALLPSQKAELTRFLRWNALPENRHYLYDYFRDNCSTRVRDVLDMALGGRIRTRTEGVPAGTTHRRESLRLLANDPLGYFGIHAGLASFVDRPIDQWEEMFIPMVVGERLREIEVVDPETGESRPLVARERVLFTGDRPPEPDAPPFTLHWFLLAGMALGGLAVLGGVRSAGWGRYLLGGVAVLWGLAAGLGGVVLLGLWFTDHVAAHGNVNMLQFNPLALGLVVLVPLGMRRARRVDTAYGLAWALLALSALGLGVAALAGQRVVEFVALAFPVYAGIAIGLDYARRARANGMKE